MFFLPLAYIFIGAFQFISAITRLFSLKRKSSQYGIFLKRYLIVASTYLAILINGFAPHNSLLDLSVFFLIYLPMILATGYFYQIRKFDKKRENIRAYDQMKTLEAPHPDRLELEALPHKVVQLVKLKSKLKLKVG